MFSSRQVEHDLRASLADGIRDAIKPVYSYSEVLAIVKRERVLAFTFGAFLGVIIGTFIGGALVLVAAAVF